MDPMIAVVGAGTMGSGIAQSAIVAGYRTLLIDSSQAALDRTVARIGQSLDKAAASGRLDADRAALAKARLRPDTSLDAVAGCTMVVEAIIEDHDAKSALFAQVSRLAPADCVLATNTSCLSVTQLSQAVTGRGRFVGLHYFFPAAINPLLEVIAGAETTPQTMEAAAAFGRATGKQPIACADVYGFAVNRFFVPYLNEAVRLADEGFLASDVERVCRQVFGTKAGPFKVMDLTKPEIALHAANTLAKLGPFYRPAPGLIAKAGKRDTWDVPETEGNSPRDAAIAERMTGAVLLAVAEALRQQVATGPDIDLGARIGLQWAYQPAAEIARLGRQGVMDQVAQVARLTGHPLPDLD